MEKPKNEKILDLIFIWLSRIFCVIIGMLLVPFLFGTSNVDSPSDFIKESDLGIDNGKLCINGSFIIARISNTKSMDPVLDNDSIVLSKPIDNLDMINVGDIIAYEASGKLIVHRIIKKESDYVIVKGDNNAVPDRYKIRESQLKRVIVGILY